MNRIAKIAVLVFGLMILSIIAVPKLLSTDYVKDRITSQLEELTGREISLKGDSSISLRPYLGVSYGNVTIGSSAQAGEEPLIMVDQLRARLGLLSALIGRARLSEVELVRPRFNLKIAQDGRTNWAITKGPLAGRLALPLDAPVETLKLGTIVVVDGIIRLDDAQVRKTHTLTSVNGRLDWSDVTSAASIEGNGVWRGEVVSLAAEADKPLDLLRGGTSAVKATLKAKPLTFVFEGELNGQEDIAKGQLSAVTPSPRHLADWVGRPIAAANSLGPSSISGQVIGNRTMLEFTEAKVEFGQQIGNGRLQIDEDETKNLSIAGTLAFDTLVLPNLSNLTSPSTVAKQEEAVDLSLLDGLAMDIRLSANAASGGPFELANLAATVIVRDGHAAFDIAQAEVMGGVLNGSISVEKSNAEAKISSDINLSDVELETLSVLYGKSDVQLAGKGDATFLLKSTGTTTDDLVLRLNGSGEIKAKNGTFQGLDVANIYASGLEGEDSIVKTGSGETPFTSLELKYFIANGTAFFRGSQMHTDKLVVALGGRSDLLRRNLALRGNISELTPQDADAEKTKPVSFFVGGTTASPLVVPLSRASGPAKENLQRKKSIPSQ